MITSPGRSGKTRSGYFWLMFWLIVLLAFGLFLLIVGTTQSSFLPAPPTLLA